MGSTSALVAYAKLEILIKNNKSKAKNFNKHRQITCTIFNNSLNIVHVRRKAHSGCYSILFGQKITANIPKILKRLRDSPWSQIRK